MAKDQNTYAKRARETAKKRKAEDKRQRRRRKKEQGRQIESAADADTADADQQTTGGEPQRVSDSRD